MSRIQTKGEEKHKKAKFSEKEDLQLIDLVSKYGEEDFITIARFMKNRNSRQCRERWRYYLSPSISTIPWSHEEECLLEQKVSELGNKWTKIVSFFPGRTDIYIKNRWSSILRKRKKNELKSQNSCQDSSSSEPSTELQSSKEIVPPIFQGESNKKMDFFDALFDGIIKNGDFEELSQMF